VDRADKISLPRLNERQGMKMEGVHGHIFAVLKIDVGGNTGPAAPPKAFLVYRVDISDSKIQQCAGSEARRRKGRQYPCPGNEDKRFSLSKTLLARGIGLYRNRGVGTQQRHHLPGACHRNRFSMSCTQRVVTASFRRVGPENDISLKRGLSRRKALWLIGVD